MEEQIDILNEKGEFTCEVRSKKDVHKLGLWYGAVHVWFLNSHGELLLQKRAKQKESYGGFWDISVAGHISAGETSIQSALREIKEELGINVVERELVLFRKVIQQSILDNGLSMKNQHNDLYIIQKDIDISDMTMQESEVQDLKYIHWKDLQKLVENDFKYNGEKLVPHPEEYNLLFR